ncbi:MAG: HAD family hydrolase [bacterium]|nr:HAD family hydrolase [bacterium]
MPKIVENVFLDLDYTIVDFDISHAQAIAAVAKECGPEFAETFAGWFQTTLEGRRIRGDDWTKVPGGRQKFEAIAAAFHVELGTGKYLPWSRQLGAVYAQEALGLPVDRAQAEHIGNFYWKRLASNVVVYPDAQKFLKRLRAAGIQFHIFTGSDSHLQWQDGTWVYDPEYSRQVKAERIQPLTGLGLQPASITIGDPIDKPHPEFYEAMMRNATAAAGKPIDPSTAITIGDSHEADVSAPLSSLGFRAGYWLKPGQPSARIDERSMSVGSLNEIPIN